MKRSNVLIAATVAGTVLLLVGLAAAVSGLEQRPRVVITATGFAAGDSVRLAASWGRVNDARGNPVASYEWAFWTGQGEDREQVRTGTITAGAEPVMTTVTQAFAAPLAGDTTYYSVSVIATDSRGHDSQPGWSAPIAITTAWTPPLPPDVQLDTVPAPPDSVGTYALGRNVAATGLALTEGDTVTLCGLAWRGGVASPPRTIEWIPPPQLALEVRPGGCAHVTALAATALRIHSGPAYLVALGF